jgi:hypothetical protein
MKNIDEPYTSSLIKLEENCPYLTLTESLTGIPITKKKIWKFKRLINLLEIHIEDVKLARRNLKLRYNKAILESLKDYDEK